MKKCIVSMVMFLVCLSMSSQTEEQQMIIELYKENYIEWISSPEVAKLLARDPELRSYIDKVSVQETKAFKEAVEKTALEREGEKSKSITELLGGGVKGISMDVIKEMVSKENTDVIVNLYWDVIRSAETKEIVDLIIPHVQGLREEFERAGVEIAKTASN